MKARAAKANPSPNRTIFRQSNAWWSCSYVKLVEKLLGFSIVKSQRLCSRIQGRTGQTRLLQKCILLLQFDSRRTTNAHKLIKVLQEVKVLWYLVNQMP